ncbi:uncharacterized protein [Ptychodera flava]|uniref:uncharacterized protein n=1 Tax=Ptychodera flava TaxID=63121 RepID=UPI00396A1C93
MWTKVIILLAILFCNVHDVEGGKKKGPKPCTWNEVEFCERFLSTYVGNPDNWYEDADKKSRLYCDFVKLRLNCLESLSCDVDNTPNSKMPLNITLWKELIAPGLENMINLGLCTDEPKAPIVSDPSDPCGEYAVTKRCMNEVSDYLKSRYAITCVAMLKAGPCFINERIRCRVQRTASSSLPRRFENPYQIISEEGHCRLIWNRALLRRQEQWRIAQSEDYYAYF